MGTSPHVEVRDPGGGMPCHLDLDGQPQLHLRWSAWRRRHRACARRCHYQRRRERHR